VEHRLKISDKAQHRILNHRRTFAEPVEAFLQPIALPERFLVMLLHSVLQFGVVTKPLGLVLGNVGCMLLERVGVLEARNQDLAFTVCHSFSSSYMGRCTHDASRIGVAGRDSRRRPPERRAGSLVADLSAGTFWRLW
jgi:hypothetical protein